MEMVLFPENCMSEYTVAKEIEHGKAWIEPCKGYLLSKKAGTVLDILRVGVLPAHQKHGLGRELVRTAKKDERTVMLTVLKSNRPAIQLYLKLGFEIEAALDTADGAFWVMFFRTS